MCIVYGMGWRNKALAFSATLTFSQRQQKKLLLRMPALINLLLDSRRNQHDSNSFGFFLDLLEVFAIFVINETIRKAAGAGCPDALSEFKVFQNPDISTPENAGL